MIKSFENFRNYKRSQNPPVILMDTTGSMSSVVNRTSRVFIIKEIDDNNSDFTGHKIDVSYDEVELLKGLRRTQNNGVWSSSKKLVYETYGGDYVYLEKDRDEVNKILEFERDINKYNL
jgi:hypothetical protein